jgi:four helix bundle protein
MEWWSNGIMKTYTHRRNVNRGYMKLEVWQLGMDLYRCVQEILGYAKTDLKLRSQLSDAALSVPANIAEGYSRRSIKEYMYHVNISLGSLSEVMTRTIALRDGEILTEERFEHFDAIHCEIENKLLALLRTLQQKAKTGTWETELSPAAHEDRP